MLIQLPIMFALYRVMYSIPAYAASVREYFDVIIAKLPAGFASNGIFTSLAEAHNLGAADYSNMDKVVDLLYKLTDKQWSSLVDAFPQIADVVTHGGENAVAGINRMQQFFGMNISYTPMNIIRGFFDGTSGITVIALIGAIAIPLLSGLSQWYSSKMITATQPQQAADDPSAGMMKSMNVTMPLMSVVFCFTFPVGIGIYWVFSSVFQIIQQAGTNAYLKKVDIDELIAKNVEKANKKRAKQGLPPTKITQNASTTLKNIQAAEEKAERERQEKMEKTQKVVKDSTEYYNQNAKPGSLAAKANMVQKYNEKNEKHNK